MPKQSLPLQYYIDKSNLIFNNEFIYSQINNFKNSKQKIEIICKKHGSFFISFHYHIIQKRGCQKCKEEINLKNNKKLLTQLLIKASIIHNNKYNYNLIGDNYKKYVDKVNIICPIHWIFKQSLRDHIDNKHGCWKCGHDLRGLNSRITMEHFLNLARKFHGNKYDYSLVKLKTTADKIKIMCPEHGAFEQTVADHIHTSKTDFPSGCKKCSGFISKKETQFLNLINLPNNTAHRQVYLKHNNIRFNVDGFKPKHKLCIEFLGDYWHGNIRIFDENIIHPKINITYRELYQKSLYKIANLKKYGYLVFYIWENQYNKIYRYINKLDTSEKNKIIYLLSKNNLIKIFEIMNDISEILNINKENKLLQQIMDKI